MRALLVLGALLVAEDVRADCGVPQWVGTADQTQVPTTGVLYVHDEALAQIDFDVPAIGIEWTGTIAGVASFTKVEDTVARIDYAGPAGSTLSVVTRYNDQRSTFRLVDRWTAPSTAPRVLQYWHHVTEWTCSSTDTLMIQVDQPAAAVRARWRYQGRTVEWIEALRTENTKAVLELGKINCGGTTIPPEQLAAGGQLELVAIRFDGSEVLIRGMPPWISTRSIASDEAGLDGAFTIVTKAAPARAKHAPQPSLAYGALAIALLMFGAWVGWHMRVRAPTDV